MKETPSCHVEAPARLLPIQYGPNKIRADTIEEHLLTVKIIVLESGLTFPGSFHSG